MHEAQQHKRTAFITLTYRDQTLPWADERLRTQRSSALAARSLEQHAVDKSRTRETRTHEGLHASLHKPDLTGFTTRLNQHAIRKFGKGVKYFACGEYGDTTHRPHYHIAVYGEDFSDDRKRWKRSNGHQLWRSSRLHELWPHGDADIGDLTFESAAYIARYLLKKQTGPKALNHYKRQDERGNTHELVPEFNVMSRRPGLAREWFLENYNDVVAYDHVISRGNPAKPPRYYDKLLEALAPYEHAQMKQRRENAPRNEEDNTPQRLAVRETVALAKLDTLKRSLE